MEEQQQKQSEKKSETAEIKIDNSKEKDSVLARMKRGFGVMYDKLRGLRDNMAEANKREEQKQTKTEIIDMSYAPIEFL